MSIAKNVPSTATAVTTALYIRLSQEDENIGESNSVKNQRDLLNDFASKHHDLANTNILYFVDDGHSGTNFNRPAVTEMLAQVRKGEIQNIVVKDFSRFGRNYIEVGGYLEQVFPFLGVRFLSVNDFFDSNDNKGRSAGLEVGFKTLIHDLYSKDLGVKSMTGKLAKTKKGELVGATAPFGYVKSKVVKNTWEIDEEAAATIRRIYSLALEGKSYVEIAKILNAEGVPSPLKHRQNKNTLHQVINGSINGMSVWRKNNVTTVLREERYTGKNIIGKSKKMSYGDIKTKIIPKSEWLIIPDTHEPIITQDVFDKVQNILGPYNTRIITKENTNLFAKKLFCGHCGYGLRRYSVNKKARPNSNYEPRYACYQSVSMKLERCLPETVKENLIKEVVLEALRVEFALASTAKEQAETKTMSLMGECEKLTQEAKRLTHEIERLKNSREQLFEDYADGTLTKEQYVAAKSELSGGIANAEAAIENITGKLSSQSHNSQQSSNYNMLMPYANAKELTPEMMSLVKRINVFADNRFEIEFTFSR